jgi:dCTP deaminase
MILSDKDIIKLIKKNHLKISPLPKEEDIKCNHINLHLHSKLIKYESDVIDLKSRDNFDVEEIIIPEKGYRLKPGEFLIGSTNEKVTIPNGYFGFVETKGNIARAGIQTHNTDGHIDPGFSGNITLEIKNNANHSIIIYPNIAFIQIYFFKATSKSINPYNGKYQNQKGGTTYLKD